MGKNKDMEQYKNGEDYANSMASTALSVLKVMGMILLGILFVIAVGFVVQLLWNWLMPELFDFKKVTYWQAMGLLLLGKIFFGGFGGSSGSKETNNKEVKGVVSKAIHDEIQKEYFKEYQKIQNSKSGVNRTNNENEHLDIKDDAVGSNEEQEALYEKWWNAIGEKQFEEYLKSQSNNH